MQHRSSSNIFEFLIIEFPFCFSDKICDDRGPRKMRFDQYVGHCIVSNFRLHLDSHSQISTATEPPSAPTLARSNLIRLPILDYPTLSNTGNVSGHPPPSFVSFVARFLSVQFCYPCHLSSYSHWLCTQALIWTWNSTMLSSPPMTQSWICDMTHPYICDVIFWCVCVCIYIYVYICSAISRFPCPAAIFQILCLFVSTPQKFILCVCFFIEWQLNHWKTSD